jgi:hypothetical protein
VCASPQHKIQFVDMTFNVVHTKGDVPVGRCSHASVVNVWFEVVLLNSPLRQASREDLFIYGGWRGGDPLNDVYKLTISALLELEAMCLSFQIGASTWSVVKFAEHSDSPTRRHGHSWTRLGDRMFAFGGLDDSQYLQDLQYFEPSSALWKNCFVSGEMPSPRSKHTMCALSNTKMLLFGGGDDTKLFNDVYIFDAGRVWRTETVVRDRQRQRLKDG